MLFAIIIYFATGAILSFLDGKNIAFAVDDELLRDEDRPENKKLFYFWFLVLFLLESSLWPYFLWVRMNSWN